jgi:hypothetical protein
MKKLSLLLLLVPGLASAHFILEAPKNSFTQNILGDPQKAPPCGEEMNSSATNQVTTYVAGQTITITINETIYHPGHYRVALGLNGPQDLPAEPVVTAGSTACGSVPIESAPTFPVLADGQLVHDAAFSGKQSFQVTIPSNVTCTHCTLQVLEFMSNHGLNNPGGCFYHHCATINVVANDGGMPPDPEQPNPPAAGCSCSDVAGVPAIVALLWMISRRLPRRVRGPRAARD